MESNNENTKKLKEGHWYKNSQTNEPIIIDSDLGDKALVQKFIRDRYSLDDELALSRQRETKADEFAEYFRYCEECKRRAKNIKGEV